VLVLPFLAACSSNGNDSSSTATAPASTATQSAPGATATTASPVIDLSKDDLGRQVTLPAKAQSVVALSPTMVELMFAVGATPVGRPSSADFPAAAASVKDFGTSYQPSFEEIVAMKPDLILADALIDAPMIGDLEKLGAPVFALRVNSFDDVVRGLRVVGQLTGNRDKAEQAASTLQQKEAAIKAKLPSAHPKVLVVVGGAGGEVFVARGDSYIGNLLTMLGADNLAANEPDSFRLPGFGEYSLERIVQADPDIIIALSPGPQPGITTQALSQSPVWNALRAVKNKRVYEVDPVIYLEASGPRVSQILDELPGILYPDVFSSH
jgi:iron complex transport system substrate-binding protein